VWGWRISNDKKILKQHNAELEFPKGLGRGVVSRSKAGHKHSPAHPGEYLKHWAGAKTFG